MTSDVPRHAEGPDEAQRAAIRAAAKRIDRVNEWLLVGGALEPDEYERFLDAGVTHVVDLREEDIPGVERLEELGVNRLQIPVPNFGPPTSEQLLQVASWLDSNGAGVSLYVHCSAGIGRAATMATGLLIHRGASVDEAIDLVKQVRPEIRLNDSQLEWLRSVDAGKNGG